VQNQERILSISWVFAKKEAKESKHWLRMVAKAAEELKDEARELWKEANELQLIFISS